MRYFEKTAQGQWRVTEWIKFRVANLLDHLPWLCWAELAMWAMNYDPWWALGAVILPDHQLFGFRSFRQCCRYGHAEEAPYCGKCWRKDRWLIGCTPQQRAEALAKYPPLDGPDGASGWPRRTARKMWSDA